MSAPAVGGVFFRGSADFVLRQEPLQLTYPPPICLAMASTLRLPVAVPRNISQSNLAASSQCRSFSQTSQQWAGGRAVNFRPPSVAQPSFKTRTKDMKLTDLPNDIGLLPGTFVRPLWRDMPSIFQAPRDRLHMEWTWMKSFFSNYTSLLQYCKRENNLPLLLRDRRRYASKLQEVMYSAFAEGNIPEIKRIACDNLGRKLIRQIEGRAKGEKVTWKLVKYLRGPSTTFTGLRVVSDRATSIPEIPKSGIRQIVVRITSRQSTTTTQTQTNGSNTEVIPISSKEQDITEYIVVQNLRWNDKDHGWRVWGTTNPTTLHATQTDPYFMPGLSAMERMEMIKDSMNKK
ncbi:unnamed protein product [Penicillium salamii]|uniref:Tim44-like domain-containing protein n=1 Tax=Penicillium salamii TaxID=1612424 RepID=A0A9W4J7X7_9EURO|nr:unnamed protein product [Penicillium salamii]CAG7984378.1 unnamed protein product [Penicillium salamii]CAG8165872.1 unnamed protein product [Penicillium salamii]CAG8235795.1 unnamed protein product [Penicillium salamii]CAG8242571.1 unnamed protein product [Penicillium salamii]